MANNNTFKKHWSAMESQYASFYSVTVVFILTTNLMLIYGFCKTSRPLTIITKLFIYLSVVDMMFMSVLITIFIVSKTEIDPISLEAITNASIYFVFLMDTFIFWTISFLRFLSINKPIYTKYKYFTADWSFCKFFDCNCYICYINCY